MSTDCCNPYSGSGSGGGGGGGSAGPTWFSFGIEGPIGAGPPGDFTYYAFPGGYGISTDEQFAEAMTAFTAIGLMVVLQESFKAGGATLTVTFRVDGVDTALTVTLNPFDHSASITGSVAVGAGHSYSVSIVGAGVSDYPAGLICQLYYST